MTTAPAPPRTYTVDDLLAMPDGDQYELVDGELREKCMGVNANETSPIVAALLGATARLLAGRLLAEQQYQVFPDPHLVRRPDLSYFRPSRKPDRATRIVQTAPDLVVEILSPTNETLDLRLKVEAWLNAGVEIVWVLLPELREVTVYARGQRPRILSADDTIDGGEVLPGFSALVADLFPAPEPAPAETLAS